MKKLYEWDPTDYKDMLDDDWNDRHQKLLSMLDEEFFSGVYVNVMLQSAAKILGNREVIKDTEFEKMVDKQEAEVEDLAKYLMDKYYLTPMARKRAKMKNENMKENVNEGNAGYEETRAGERYQMEVLDALQSEGMNYQEADNMIDIEYELIGDCLYNHKSAEKCAELIMSKNGLKENVNEVYAEKGLSKEQIMAIHMLEDAGLNFISSPVQIKHGTLMFEDPMLDDIKYSITRTGYVRRHVSGNYAPWGPKTGSYGKPYQLNKKAPKGQGGFQTGMGYIPSRIRKPGEYVNLAKVIVRLVEKYRKAELQRTGKKYTEPSEREHMEFESLRESFRAKTVFDEEKTTE